MRFIICVIVALSLYSKSSIAFPVAGAEFISDEMIVSIAKRSIELQNNCNTECNAELYNESRVLKVREFLASVGGGEWFRNWSKKFGAPTSKEERVFAKLIGNNDKELGFYYIRPSPHSVQSMTVLSCEGNKKDLPTMKAFCGLAMNNARLQFNDNNALKSFISISDWFVEKNNNGKWEWSIDVESRNLKAPWISCLTQSLGISVLLRRYQLDGSKNHLNVAKQALDVMAKDVNEGGCSHQTIGGTWYEEYPNIKKPSHVLNGHMWALFGIYDFYRVTGDQKSYEMFNSGMSSLITELPKYDVGNWSVYSQDNKLDLVEGNYQAFIIEQLKVLHSISGDERFLPYIKKWEDTLLYDRLFVDQAAAKFNEYNR